MIRNKGLEVGLRNIMYHLLGTRLSGKIKKKKKMARLALLTQLDPQAHLWSIVQDRGVHALVRQHPNLLSAQICEKVDPVGIVSTGAQTAQSRGIQPELTTYFQRSGTKCVGFRRSQPLRIFLDYKRLD